MQQNEKRDEMRRRTAKFSANIVRFCTRLASRPECWKLASQLLDAGTSVASNYHAALRARSRAEFIAKLGVANEESDESVLWLVTIRDGGLEASEELQRLLQEATELRAIISRSRSTAIRNEKNRAELGRHPSKHNDRR